MLQFVGLQRVGHNWTTTNVICWTHLLNNNKCDSNRHRPQIRSYLYKWAKTIPTSSECTAQRQRILRYMTATIHRVEWMSSRVIPGRSTCLRVLSPSVHSDPKSPPDWSPAAENSVWCGHGLGLGTSIARMGVKGHSSSFWLSTNGFWSWTSLPWLRASQLVTHP